MSELSPQFDEPMPSPLHAAPAFRPPATPGSLVDGGGYLDVDGATIWHLHVGDPAGPATVLIHGAFASAATWAAQIADLSGAGHDVYIPERSGHGHSPDIDGPFTFESMAAQTIAYLERVVVRPANLVGWSDGAVLALLVARERPDLVNRVVFSCGYVGHDGQNAQGFFDRLVHRDPSTYEYLRNGYTDFSPDPADHFDVVYDKTVELLCGGPNYAIEEFSGVRAPTLVVAADQGVVHLEHNLAMVRALPHARLAVLPGTHILPAEAPELFNPLVESFLAADPPKHWHT